MNWISILETNGINASPLKYFKPYRAVALMDEDELKLTKDWLLNYAIGFDVLPLFSNRESDFVGVYTNGFLKGKVAIVNHDNINFAPQFKSVESFLNAYKKAIKKEDFYDWQDFDKPYDYPIIDESEAESQLLQECWHQIETEQLHSSTHKEIVYKTLIGLTPPSQLDTLLHFLNKDFALNKEHKEIVDYAMEVLGVVHLYQPAKPLIAELLKTKTFKNYYNRSLLYNGEFKKNTPLIIKIISFPLLLMSFLLLGITIIFTEIIHFFKTKIIR